LLVNAGSRRPSTRPSTDDRRAAWGGLAVMTRTLKPGRVLTCVAAAAALAVPLGMAGTAGAARGSSAAPSAGAAAISPPVPHGALRIAGRLRDGSAVRADGLSWRPSPLPPGDTLLSFEVGYAWQACTTRSGGPGSHCVTGADSTVTPFAAQRYIAGHADTGKYLKITETATEVVETDPATFTFKVIRASRSYTAGRAVGRYPHAKPPVSGFLNGLPERQTSSTQEYFQVSPPHYNAANGPVSQSYRVDGGPWRPMPGSRVFETSRLGVGRHRVEVRTADAAGDTVLAFRWWVVPLPAPVPCSRPGGSCWYPPHLDRTGHPMRWDWQIGRVTPRQRTGRRAVDIYDIDGFLTTPAEIHQIHTAWQASTLAHPKAVCYLDLAWEDYRPDASPAPDGRFPAAALGKIYYGYPEERWVDFRQLDALKPMLNARIAMCARKGFDAVELDDIDSFDPPSTTGFHLTPGDAQNYLAYAYNQVHRDGMTVLWKNSPLLASWGVRYADGAVVEECYTYGGCPSWDVFTAGRTAYQPTGKWVGEAEYGADHYVCNPGQSCPYKRRFTTFCARVYAPPGGFAAVKFDVDLDGRVFYPCPTGS
jgi:hypothetical protein